MAKKSAPETQEQLPLETETQPDPQVPPAPETTASTPESPPAPETPAANPLLEKFTAAGFEGVDSVETAAERALEAIQQRQSELENLRKEYEQNKPFIEYGHQYFKQQQAAPAPEPEAKPGSWFNPPAVDMRLVQHYQETKINPATNEPETVWKANAPADLKAAYDARNLYTEQWAQKLVHDPIEALEPFRQQIRQEVLEEVKALYGETMQQQTVEQYVSSFERDNADWLFAKDPLTQKPLLNQLTPEAEQLFGEAQEFGITDPQRICQYVLKHRTLATQAAAGQQASTQAQAAQVAEQRRREITARNASPPNRSGTTLPPENGTGQQNRNLSLRKKLEQAFAEDGVTV